MRVARPTAIGVQNVAFFAVVLAYAWVGIDTRFLYHWQGPVFYTFPGFFQEFLKYPGGPVEYLYALISQVYTSREWGAIVLTAQIAAAAAVTQTYFTALAGRALRLVRFLPATLLLIHANLYYDRTPLPLALMVGLASVLLFVRISRRWRSEAASFGVFAAISAADYYLAGMAVVFFALGAAIAQIAGRPRVPFGIAYLLWAAALPAAAELFRLTYVPVTAREWFVSSDLRRTIVLWSIYGFYAAATAMVLRRRSAAPAQAAARPDVSRAARHSRKTRKPARPRRTHSRWLPAALATLALLLGLGGVTAASYQLNSRDRRLVALSYYASSEDWPAVIDASQGATDEELGAPSRYAVNLALHMLNRLGDEMFRFPQASPMLPPLEDSLSLPDMLQIADLCLRLGRVNDAEHFGSEAMVLSEADPRVYRLMARIYMTKGQTAAARKFLTVLTYGATFRSRARQYLRELDRDPELADDPEVQLLRRRRLRKCDMLAVWQRGPKADTERLLLDQLQQDPTNRMAFEFLMGSYLLSRDLDGARALLSRIKDMTGPAYVGADGRRRTPRCYQEAMAVHAGLTRKTVEIEGFEVQPETFQRITAFSRIIGQVSSTERAKHLASRDFRDSYFFYYAFGPGGDR